MNLIAAVLLQILTVGPLAPFNSATVQQLHPTIVAHLPAEGIITSIFGVRYHPVLRFHRQHQGIDIANKYASLIYAAAAGRIRRIGFQGGYGLMVEIDHGNGWQSRYAHLASTSLKAGDYVWSGAIIGRMGASGVATGSHLHFELRFQGHSIDPIPYLEALYPKNTVILAKNDGL